MYSVLGAQARTHWSIVSAGARSLQTQEIFAKIVRDCIAQDDDSILVSNMRTAAKNTDVVLNMSISPGVELIPSEMTILKKPVPGYNNVLTLATKDMRSGKNDKLNFYEPTNNTNEPGYANRYANTSNKPSEPSRPSEPVTSFSYHSCLALASCSKA